MLAVEPLAVEAAFGADELCTEQQDERKRALELERTQAQYEAKLAARRYESVDPDNRLVAAELEARWNAAMQRLQECEARLSHDDSSTRPRVAERKELLELAKNLEAVWNAPSADARTKQRIVRALIEEIAVDVDDETRDVIMVIHWRGGQHSQVRFRKPAPGEHTMRNGPEVDELIRQMGARWSDEHIAADAQPWARKRRLVIAGMHSARRLSAHQRDSGL
jgi:hypothetical protein